jgi:hypothetical protein
VNRQRLYHLITVGIVLAALGLGRVGNKSAIQAQGGCPAIQNTPQFTVVYGNVVINGAPAAVGTVVQARSPRNDVVGCFTVTQTGNYGAMYIYGEDTSVTPSIPGLRAGESVTFLVDDVVANAGPGFIWQNGINLHQVDLSMATVSLSGSVTLQGRPAPPEPRWQVPLTVDLYVSGQPSPLYQFNPTTDDGGNFTISGFAPGTYALAVKNSHTLGNVKTVNLATGANPIDFGTLREGDVNNDNYVTILDLSILAGSYNQASGNPGYDQRADLNEDGLVNILDLSLLAGNYNQAGQFPN